MDNDLSCQGTERSQAEITPPQILAFIHPFNIISCFEYLFFYVKPK